MALYEADHVACSFEATNPAGCGVELTAQRFEVSAVTKAHERVYAGLTRSRWATSSTESVL